jgi:DNA-binding response OmpR family regulator
MSRNTRSVKAAPSGQFRSRAYAAPHLTRGSIETRTCNASAPQVIIVDPRFGEYLDISEYLEDSGYCVEHCESGRDALRKNPLNPQLWVVNIHLPDMSGPDLLSLLRWRHPGARICLVSDNYQIEDEIRARSVGAELYLSKPIVKEWLTEAAAVSSVA